jgi:hypothetical protein
MSAAKDNILLNMDDLPFDENLMFNQFDYDLYCNLKYDDVTVATNIKDLLLICEYYGFAKEIRTNKYNKNDVVHMLFVFERDLNNQQIVAIRRQLWYYMNELKKDKFMKKFVIWK